jgi:hypothetical protein
MATEHFRRSARLKTSVLIGIFALTTLVLSPTTSGAQTPNSYHATFTYECCSASALHVNTIYHPGDVLKLRWIPETNTPTLSKQPTFTIVLSANISGPFASVVSLKKAFARAHPKRGRVNSKAITVRLSNRKSANPVSLIRIPANAGEGYYELTTSVAGGSVSSGGGSIIRITPRVS